MFDKPAHILKLLAYVTLSVPRRRWPNTPKNCKTRLIEQRIRIRMLLSLVWRPPLTPRPEPGARCWSQSPRPARHPQKVYTMGVPLRPDPLALRMMERRSFNRAVAA